MLVALALSSTQACLQDSSRLVVLMATCAAHTASSKDRQGEAALRQAATTCLSQLVEANSIARLFKVLHEAAEATQKIQPALVAGLLQVCRCQHRLQGAWRVAGSAQALHFREGICN